MNQTYHKATGSGGSKGTHFQLNLMCMFVLKALQQNIRHWRLSTENTSTGKFDDVVFEFSDGRAILLQAKHKENKKITKDQLLSTNSRKDDFSLPKYFLSYLEIRKTVPVELLIICTNTQIDINGSMMFLKQNSIEKESMLHYEDGRSFYTFNDNILSDLITNAKLYYKNNSRGKGVDETMITEENARKFLEHLQFYAEYPSGNELEKAIKKLLSDKSISNLMVGISYLPLHQKIKDWFEQPKGEYLTENRIKAMFCELKSENYLEVLKNYKISFQNKNLDRIIAVSENRIFFVTAEGGLLLYLLKVYYNINYSKNNILYASCDYDRHTLEETIKAFQLPQYNFLIISSRHFPDQSAIREICRALKDILEKMKYKRLIFIQPNNKLAEQIKSIFTDYDVFDKLISLEDLSHDTQRMLLKRKSVIFQGEDMSLEELFPEQTIDDQKKCITSDILEKIITGRKYIIGENSVNLEEKTFYLNRHLHRVIKDQSNKNEKVSMREEIISEENICNINEKIILISDIAGMGKTTTLKSLTKKIKKNNSRLWVIRIELNNVTDILKEYHLKNTTLSILELLNYTNSLRMTDKLERLLFSVKGKVILMLDGIDEISPDYTELILNLLYQSQEAENLKKVFVTTRTHMTKELEEHLNVRSFQLVPFTKNNQIDFLTWYWVSSLQIHNTKIERCERYATILIRKVSSWLREFSREGKFVGSPLNAKILAEVFSQTEENLEGCKEYLNSDNEEPTLPEMMNIVDLYRKFIEKKRYVFISKKNPTGIPITNQVLREKFEDCLVYHRISALKVIFEEGDECKLFSFYDEGNDPNMEIILQMGIVQRLYNQLIFIHRTFAEYFVAESIFIELQRGNSHVQFQKLLLDEILFKGKYQVIRQYLNDFLQNRISSLTTDKFIHYMSVVHNTNNSDLIHRLAEEANHEIIRFVLKLVNFQSSDNKHPLLSLGNNISGLFKKKNTLNIIKYSGGIDIKHAGLTPLYCAVFNGQLETVKFLLIMGADVNCTSEVNRGVSNLWSLGTETYRLYTNFYSYWRVLILENVIFGMGRGIWEFITSVEDRPNIVAKTGETALLCAARRGNADIVDLLIKNGADLNVTGEKGNTALHFAAMSGSLKVVQCLLKQGITVNAVNSSNETPLCCAANRGYFDIVETIVEYGGDANIGNMEDGVAVHSTVGIDCLELLNF